MSVQIINKPEAVEIKHSALKTIIIAKSDDYIVEVDTNGIYLVRIGSGKYKILKDTNVVSSISDQIAGSTPSVPSTLVTLAELIYKYFNKSQDFGLVIAKPEFASAEVGAVADDEIHITVSKALSNKIQSDKSAFSTSGITGSPAISSVVIDGTDITITMASDVTNGDTVLVTYAVPSANPDQTTDQLELVAFTDKSVTNTVSA